MTEENKVQALPHNLIMENRNRLTVSGVSDVDSFDEQTVVIFTQMGELTVRGSDLHIINLNVDSGELSLEGTVNSLTYSDEQLGKGGFFSRVFRCWSISRGWTARYPSFCIRSASAFCSECSMMPCAPSAPFGRAGAKSYS